MTYIAVQNGTFHCDIFFLGEAGEGLRYIEFALLYTVMYLGTAAGSGAEYSENQSEGEREKPVTTLLKIKIVK